MGFQLDEWVGWGLWIAGMPLGAFTAIHALLQRADAFTAADRMTKLSWVGITVAAALGLVVFRPLSVTFTFWIAALVAALVYLVDVRPKLIEVQRGHK